MTLIPYTTSFPLPVALIPQSIIIEEHFYITDIRYSAEAHIYCSAQSSLFSHIVPNADVNNFILFYSSVKGFLCAVVLAAYCLLSSDKNNETLHDVDIVFWMSLFMSVVIH